MLIFRMFSWIYKSSKDRRYTSRCYNCCWFRRSSL
jgi:hypothetical protein